MTKTVRYYDCDTQKVAKIPAIETTERTIRGRVEGVEGEVHFDHGLSDDQVDRVKRVAATFAEVHPDPLEKWIHDFNLDLDPERDIESFEMMAVVYEQVVEPSDTPGRKQQFYGGAARLLDVPGRPLHDREGQGVGLEGSGPRPPAEGGGDGRVRPLGLRGEAVAGRAGHRAVDVARGVARCFQVGRFVALPPETMKRRSPGSRRLADRSRS